MTGLLYQGERPPAGHQDQVLGAELGPVEPGHQGQALSRGNQRLLGDVAECVGVPEVGGRGKDLRGACQV